MKHPIKILALLAFLAGILGLLHQKFFTSGGWFDWGQVGIGEVHHEQHIIVAFLIGFHFLLFFLIKRSYGGK